MIAVRSALCIALLGLSGTVMAATPVQLVTNGGFETGDFTGWTVTDRAGGLWYVDNTDGLTPLSNRSTVGPASGDYYAVTDMTSAGTHVLEQTFTVPVDATFLTLSFDMFMNDWRNSGPIVNPAGLDHRALPNQHARVDILTALATPFSTSASDIVATLVAPTVDTGADPNPYTAYSFDLSALLTPGATYKLRFGEVDNQGTLNLGLDNVSLAAASAPVPEPETYALMLAGLGLVGWAARRRAR